MSPETPREAKTTYILIKLRPSSFGRGETALAVLQGKGGVLVGHVPVKDIKLEQQRYSDEPIAILNVEIVEKKSIGTLCSWNLNPEKS
ncbi:MAG TPA: hypothetical protein VJ227_00720 [Patescibacteria group bacterium]|nr:hypothetical protein [Patescibacteria group bacterium]